MRVHPLSLFRSQPDHRHLPSSPPRRSSDLHGDVAGDGLDQLDVVARQEIAIDRFAEAEDKRPMATSCRDRKSTRLNSSHLGTSYAVLCLQKKTMARATHSSA